MEHIELELTTYGTTSLRSLLEALKDLPETAPVVFDFCYLNPTTVDSYRGYYEHLALGWSTHGDKQNRDMRRNLSDANGSTFEGYKGGEYMMTPETPVWVDNYGDVSRTAIVAIEFDYVIRLITKSVG